MFRDRDDMAARRAWLEQHADRPEVQAEIAHLIRLGTIRVAPGGPHRIRVLPAGGAGAGQSSPGPGLPPDEGGHRR